MLTLITPTCDQPTGFALCELYIARQTVKPDRWIVVDDGVEPIAPTMGQEYIRRRRDAEGFASFAANLRAGLYGVREGVVAFAEHDDWYAPTHLERVLELLERPGALAAGDDRQRYYNVARRCYRVQLNVGASLCQTAMRAKAIPLLLDAIAKCEAKRSYGIDTTFWRALPREAWSTGRPDTVVGIKGLPGRAGLGMGHRPETWPGWASDPDLVALREYIGDDADRYAGFAQT